MIRENIIVKPGSMFNLRTFHKKYFEMPLHQHPEYEIVFIKSGRGKKFIGDAITPFSDGDLTIIGPDIPHMFMADDEYFNNNDLYCTWNVIQFKEGILPSDYSSFDLFGTISNLLADSAYGIDFHSEMILSDFSSMFRKLYNERSFNRLSIMYELLSLLSKDKSRRRLNIFNSQESVSFEDQTVRKIYNYLIHNYKNNISLDEIAGSVCMQRSTVCSYFKRHTLRTIFETLTDIRIGHACDMLINTRLPIYQIADETGFNNLSNFNRHFYALKKVTPTDYRKLHAAIGD